MSELAKAPGSARRLLDAAAELLVTEGYEALSMRRLASRVGLTQAAIYRHFANKAELVDRIVEEGYTGILALVEELGAELAGGRAEPPELLARGIRAYVGFALRNSGLFKAVLLQDIGPSRGAVDLLGPDPARRRTFAVLVSLVEAGIARGSFAPADPGVTARALWAAMFGLAARAAIEGAGKGREADAAMTAILEREIELLLGGLGTGAGKGKE